MERWLRKLIDGYFPNSQNKFHLAELLLTVVLTGMSFMLVALMLARFSGESERPADQRSAKPRKVNLVSAEVPLGEFNSMFASPSEFVSGTGGGGLHVLQYDATALIRDRNETELMRTSLGKYRNRVRATFDSVTRGASEEELLDPELTAIRGRIRSRINTMFKDELVKEVVFSDFRYYKLQ